MGVNARMAQLANHINRTVTGPMWHGPALADVLNDLTYETAALHSIGQAHSIWEIVLHITTWAEIARARLRGERIADPSDQEDWPPVGVTSAAAWTAAIDRLKDSYRALASDVKELDEARLAEKVDGLDYTVSNLLHGVIEHGTYHGGQIALLKKASSSLPR